MKILAVFERRSRLEVHCNSAREGCSCISYICLGPCPVILVAVIKVGDITVAVIWVESEVWSFWSRSLRSRSFRSWSCLSVF